MFILINGNGNVEEMLVLLLFHVLLIKKIRMDGLVIVIPIIVKELEIVQKNEILFQVFLMVSNGNVKMKLL